MKYATSAVVILFLAASALGQTSQPTTQPQNDGDLRKIVRALQDQIASLKAKLAEADARVEAANKERDDALAKLPPSDEEKDKPIEKGMTHDEVAKIWGKPEVSSATPRGTVEEYVDKRLVWLVPENGNGPYRAEQTDLRHMSGGSAPNRYMAENPYRRLRATFKDGILTDFQITTYKVVLVKKSELSQPKTKK